MMAIFGNKGEYERAEGAANLECRKKKQPILQVSSGTPRLSGEA
jgi:hypothetical protein